MDEIISNCVLSLSKKELYKIGIRNMMDAAVRQLMRESEDKFADVTCDKLKDFDNMYQFILTIKEVNGSNE